jgi:hypothetical protein
MIGRPPVDPYGRPMIRYRTVPLMSRVPSARLGVVVAIVVVASALGATAVFLTSSGHPGAVPVAGSAGSDPSGSARAPAPASATGSPSASSSASPAPSGSRPASGAPGPGPGWKLVWSPRPPVDGLGAFEGVEDDRAGSDPGVKHIYVQGDDYRFDMPLKERDSSPDRQRNEVKGMHANGQDLSLGLGETWRLDWSLYIPTSLKATNRFTHIMQLKMPGNGSAPILTMDLSLQGGVPKIQVKIFDSGAVVGATNLAPLQNRWLTTSLVFTIGDAPNGMVAWTLSAGGGTVVNASRTGVDTWLQDRVRPKWGIYRSVEDTSGSLQDCYLLISNVRAYQKT